ncbi:MAG: 2,3-diphosphoglycerate synthetase [Gaiellales bacterium]
MTLLALIDGEHYPPVVRAALEQAAQEQTVAGALLLGGTEKLTGAADYGVPVDRVEAGTRAAAAMLDAARRLGADTVLDLSDEPVVGQDERIELACHALAAGLRYCGPDYDFRPPPRQPMRAPSVAVIGTGKRVGKTSVSAHLARLADADGRAVAVLAMGRGGPERPEAVDGRRQQVGVEQLLARAGAGGHAASDFLEDAALAGVPTVGARRCGGGLFGRPAMSNVPEAAELEVIESAELVVVEGSGSAVPPLATDRTVLVHAATAGPAGRGFDRYRLLLADLLVVTMCETGLDAGVAVSEDVPMIRTVLRPHPARSVAGRRIAYFTTAADPSVPVRDLAERHGAQVVAVSANLADRARLRADLESPAVLGADAYLVEVKAAGIDTVARSAVERGIEVVLCDNRPRSIDGEPDLDELLRGLAAEAVAEHA